MNGHKPTKEAAWMAAVIDLGCIVCRNDLSIFSPCEIHHIDGSKKPGAHFETIGLCFPHHRKGNHTIKYTSHHPHKYQFQLRYGSEKSLLKQTQELIGENDEFE